MPFTPKAWVDGAVPAGRLNAAAMIDLETRLAAYADNNLVTKRFSTTIGSPNGITANAGAFTYMQRMVITMPTSTTQWRLKVANQNAQTASNPNQAATVDTVYVGTPAYDATTGFWIGSCTSTLSLALSSTAVTVAANGADGTSAWVTNPAHQFIAHEPLVISMAITVASGGTGTVISDCQAFTGVGINGQVADAVPAGIGAANWIYDVRIEADAACLNGTPVGLFLCTSDGSYNPDGGLLPTQGWPTVSGLQNGHPVTNAALGGSTSSDWLSLAGRPYTRFDLATYPPDYGVIGCISSNDILALPGGDSASAGQITSHLAAMQTNLATILGNLKTIGCKRTHLTSIPPRNFNPANSFENCRLQMNLWMRKLPLGVEAVVDMDHVIRNTISPFAIIDPLFVSSDGFHFNAAGHQRVGRETRLDMRGKAG